MYISLHLCCCNSSSVIGICHVKLGKVNSALCNSHEKKFVKTFPFIFIDISFLFFFPFMFLTQSLCKWATLVNLYVQYLFERILSDFQPVFSCLMSNLSPNLSYRLPLLWCRALHLNTWTCTWSPPQRDHPGVQKSLCSWQRNTCRASKSAHSPGIFPTPSQLGEVTWTQRWRGSGRILFQSPVWSLPCAPLGQTATRRRGLQRNRLSCRQGDGSYRAGWRCIWCSEAAHSHGRADGGGSGQGRSSRVLCCSDHTWWESLASSQLQGFPPEGCKNGHYSERRGASWDLKDRKRNTTE